MANMSYCRFENTLSDLRDCYEALEHDSTEELSPSEFSAMEKLIHLCRRISEQYGDSVFPESHE